MVSTETHETRSINCGFLHKLMYIAVLAIVVFGMWKGVRVPAPIQALTRLHVYIVHLLERPSFRFLDLPPEIRKLVYHHHFTLYRTSWYYRKFRQTPMLPDAILNVNRQVYEEASHALYSEVVFVIRTTGTPNVHGDRTPFAGVTRAIPHVVKHVATIHLEIQCPRSGRHGRSGKDEGRGRSVTALKTNIKTVCASLAKLPNLRTIDITFLAEDSSGSLRPRAPAKFRIPVLLRPLKLVRRANPDIVVQMPDYCPISTAELAEQQRECPWGSDYWAELNEDCKEFRGVSMAVGGELGRTDGGLDW
ncbi:hypothetical protein HO133_001495 [Letharia lupina]|uniref:Uncharacterized protein n=1 Tax=Letharia lupina TaxID=560253 RepID=A0A8H6FC59_9LECA|nr:uncharacterized protein HO133_001495 [Letharia lupina]KAF6222409.1 hypothetical protein HO133_001495 [Letharia lupina]